MVVRKRGQGRVKKKKGICYLDSVRAVGLIKYMNGDWRAIRTVEGQVASGDGRGGWPKNTDGQSAQEE